MKNIFSRVLHVLLLATGMLALAQEVPVQKPPAPVIDVPPIISSKLQPVCIGCMPFDPAAHKKLLEKLVGNKYVGELRRALYLQDSAHQFESKAHFDNCDFANAVGYVQELLATVGDKVSEAQAAAVRGDKITSEEKITQAFFALGQALHGTQDFYAHTNYLEMHAASAMKVQQIQSLPIWTEAGAKQIEHLGKTGLKSGYVFWGVPQACSGKSPTHAELAKDTEKTASGKIRIAHFQNMSQFTAAQFLARRASIELVTYAFAKWPLLKEMNGEVVAFEVLIENRGLAEPEK